MPLLQVFMHPDPCSRQQVLVFARCARMLDQPEAEGAVLDVFSPCSGWELTGSDLPGPFGELSEGTGYFWARGTD